MTVIRHASGDIVHQFLGYHLHITNRDMWGGDSGWEVWLNTELAAFDGLCIGGGNTKEDAIRDAQTTLLRVIGLLCDGDNR